MALNIIVGKFPDFQRMQIWEGGSDQILQEFVSKDQITFYRC